MSKKVDLFAYLNAISFNKENILTEETEKEYNPYMINRYLSAEFDTIFLANEMSLRTGIDKRMHFDFLRLAVPSRKRFFKYIKKDKIENELLIKKYYSCNHIKAKEYLEILTDEDIEYIKNKLDSGGVKDEVVRKPRKSKKI